MDHKYRYEFSTGTSEQDIWAMCFGIKRQSEHERAEHAIYTREWLNKKIIIHRL